jgi:hypothetical protein
MQLLLAVAPALVIIIYIKDKHEKGIKCKTDSKNAQRVRLY